MVDVSPLAPDSFPKMPVIPGVRLAVGKTKIKYKGRDDLMVVQLATGTKVAGVYTRSLTSSAPVEWCRKNLRSGQAEVLVVNSGNANAFTGKTGVIAVERIADAVASLNPCCTSKVFVASTGVIGESLPYKKLTSVLPKVMKTLSENKWKEAAHSILTTDTYPKGATRTADIGGTSVTINGIAKGSGMIAPDMATMLAFIFTDADVDNKFLQKFLSEGANLSFNAITVDSDTSTSDSLMLFATGKAGNDKDSPLDDFKEKLIEVLIDLACQVVRDGEGASKFISVTISGADDDGAARRIGLAIANSPLVKTAVAGEDPNWGRIVMAVGKAGEKANRDKLAINIGGIAIAKGGQVLSNYNESPVAKHMKGKNIDISVDVGIARGKATVWTCDLTHKYISINADYRS